MQLKMRKETSQRIQDNGGITLGTFDVPWIDQFAEDSSGDQPIIAAFVSWENNPFAHLGPNTQSLEVVSPHTRGRISPSFTVVDTVTFNIRRNASDIKLK